MMDLVANSLAALEAFESLAGAAGGAAVHDQKTACHDRKSVMDLPSAANFLALTTSAHGHCHEFLRSLSAQSIS